MIRVDIYKQANYPVSSPKIKRRLREFLAKKGIVSNAQVEVALVGVAQMRKIDRKIHNVLSFTPEEAKKKFIYPLDGVIHLGEIVVCFPKVVEEAKQEEKLIEEKVYELVEHGARHLLGEHHEL
jgi:rRNA maturation RNase YbeY